MKRPINDRASRVVLLDEIQVMKKIILLLLVLSLWAFAPSVFASDATGPHSGYFAAMKHDFVRGFKNIIGSPLEIPITIQEYHEKAGRPVIRHFYGFVDGCFRTVTRFGSGAWDWFAALIPGAQDGFPVKPETLF